MSDKASPEEGKSFRDKFLAALPPRIRFSESLRKDFSDDTRAIALHQYFLSIPSSAVPAFLMIDQPSQVYFPKKLAGRKANSELDPKLDDDDAKRVRRLFVELARVTLTENKERRDLQLVVVDHAGKTVWGDIPGVHFVEEWRGQKKLVPISWIDEPHSV